MKRLPEVAGWIAAGLLLLSPVDGADPVNVSTTEKVGRRAANRVFTPVNQLVTPLGRQTELPGMRPQAMALSPDGRLLVVSGKTSELIVLDPVTGGLRQKVALPSDKQNEPMPGVASANILKPDKDGQVSYTGLIFSPDGRRIYLSNVNGSIKVFAVAANGAVSGLFSIPLPKADAPRRAEEIPAGLALSPDGRRLYVCFNLSNRLGELDAATGRLLRTFDVGVAPYDVKLVGEKAYVSNWGGRRPGAGDVKGPAGRGMEVRVDPVRFIANDGSVSILHLPTGRSSELVVGLHASALAVSPNQRYVVVANAGSDNLSVIDTRTDQLVETIWAKVNPADLFGASPNALAFESSGKSLFVANGTQNAVGIIRFEPGEKESRLIGMVPAGWFPGALAYDPLRRNICVANIKGHSPGRVSKHGGVEFNSHQYHGTVSIIPLPTLQQLPGLSEIVARNLRREALEQAKLPARAGQPPRPVPERVGEPSVFRHVVYIIKENRTYDQVFGDLPQGNGQKDLCIFPEEITPNQHKLVREFVLLDNTYCAGILSADGHQWSTTAFSTDYMEKSFAGFPRSYPDGMGEDEMDALAYAPSGFIWDNALKHGKTLRNFGEFALPAVRWTDRARKGSPKWTDCWNEFNQPTGAIHFASEPAIESLRPHLATNTVGWIMEVPDVFRARYFIQELRTWEAKGEFPNLVIICLPNDHTSGTAKGSPTPAACVADNDLAFGQIVEAISKSRFWKDTCILAIEDDPQAGWDHVSGYRTTAYCISPYTKRGAVVSTQYNTTSLLRTMEQILGLPPMNQFDATATLMSDCFTETPDFRPFEAVPNRVPLNTMNPSPQALRDPILRRDAIQSARLNLRKPDACPEQVLNRILWHATMGTSVPFPEWAITHVEDDDDDD